MPRPRKNYANPDPGVTPLGDLAGERVLLDPDRVRAAELAEQEEFEDLDDQEDGELGRVIDEIASSGAVRLLITRTMPAEKKGYCGEMVTAEFTQELVKKRYGPGRYRIRCMGTKGLVRGGGTIDIADTPLPEGGPAGGSIEEVLGAIEKREEMRRAAANESRLQYVTILAPVIGPIVAAMIGNKGPDLTALIAATRGPSLADVTATMANLKAMQGGEETKLESFVKMLEVAQNLGGKGGSDTNWLDILKEGLGMARPALEGIIQNAATRLPGGSFTPTTPSFNAPAALSPPSDVKSLNVGSSFASTADGAPASNPSEGDAMLKLLPWLKHQLEFLTVKAARDSDPELYAELLVDNIPDGVPPEKVLSMLSRSDWWELLSSFSPGVKPYVGWFARLHAALLELLQGPDETDREEPEPSGHPGEPS